MVDWYVGDFQFLQVSFNVPICRFLILRKVPMEFPCLHMGTKRTVVIFDELVMAQNIWGAYFHKLPGKQPLLFISINLGPLKPAIQLPQKMVH